MKRFAALFAVMLLLLVFTGCENSEETEKYCWSCGAGISKDVSYCGQCGAAAYQPTATASPTKGASNSEKPSDAQGAAHTHSYSENVTAPTCTEKGYTTYTCACGDSYTSNQTEATGHSYNKNVTLPTCTEQGYTTYTCTCGDTYKADYINPSHNYVNNICTSCGSANANYTAYQAEYTQLTEDYNDDIAELQSKIATSQSNIDKSQQAINNARSSLASLSPSCPQWLISEYVSNWREYGDTWTATQAAQNAWTQQYNSQKAQYEDDITVNTSKIQAEQTNISLYNNAISTLTDQYNTNIGAIKVKYGMQ